MKTKFCWRDLKNCVMCGKYLDSFMSANRIWSVGSPVVLQAFRQRSAPETSRAGPLGPWALLRSLCVETLMPLMRSPAVFCSCFPRCARIRPRSFVPVFAPCNFNGITALAFRLFSCPPQPRWLWRHQRGLYFPTVTPRIFPWSDGYAGFVVWLRSLNLLPAAV